MQGMIAFCENPNCGAVFEHGGIFGGAGSATIQMTDMRIGPCPSCGGFGAVPDGVYKYANQFISLINGPLATIEMLTRVEALIMKARESNKSKDEIIDEIDKEIPEASEFIRGVPDIRVVSQWFTLVISILTFAILIHTTYLKDDPEQDKYQDMFLEHLLKENERLHQQNQPPTRNSPCECGSGQRYKHCCGQLI